VYLNTSNSEASFGGATVVKNAIVKETNVVVEDDYNDDDLPF
jgi:hypothetical protein